MLDPAVIRYRKIKSITPTRFRYTAPPILGEAGWKEDGGVVNHDVAILQERLQLFYWSGAASLLDEARRPTLIEIGSGYGGMSLAFARAFPNLTQVLCDIPQTLIMAYVYLNVAVPEANHFVVTTKGIRAVPGRPVQPQDAFSQPAFIYLPNYLFPEYARIIQPQVAYNAMSLHELHPAAIGYYCRMLPQMLDRGVFFEVNTLPGVPNVAIDEKLPAGFPQRLDINLPTLGFRPRIWSCAQHTIDQLGRAFEVARQRFVLDQMFDFDFVFEYPRFDERVVRDKIANTIDLVLGMRTAPPDKEPMTGNHLAYIVRRSKGIWE